MGLLTEIGFFIAEKLFGSLFNLFKKGITINPRNKLIKPIKLDDSEIRYVLYITNKDKRPYYNIDLTIATAEKINIYLDSSLGKEFKPRQPIAFGNPQNPSFIELGGMFFFQNKDGSKWLQKIPHIDPEESIKYEVVLSKINNKLPFKIKHTISYSKTAEPITIKRQHTKNQQSIEMHGINWNLKK